VPNNTSSPKPDDQHSHDPLMTRSDFANWGADQIAYVRPARHGEIEGYAVHAADGREVGFAETYDLAAASILQHDLFPLSVH